MSKAREPNYDLLRICSAFAVVILHVSAEFLRYGMHSDVPTNCTIALMFFNIIVRFAVPCFFMLSGAFILADERNADYKYFYKKSVKNIGITGAIVCLLYVLYNIVKLITSVFILHKHETDYMLHGMLSIIKSLIVGSPFGHLWYLFTLIGIYILAPFVIRLAADLRGGGVNLYGNITVVFLALASASYITSEHILKWDIGWQFCFLSYFLMGYKLRQWGKSRKNNKVALLLIAAGFAVNAIIAYINFLRGLKGLPVGAIQYYNNPFSYAPLAPIEVIASCLIFSGFSVMNVKKDFSKLAGYTFLIYLVHAGVWDVISTVVGDRLIGNQLVEAVATIIISIVVFMLSLLVAVIYKRFQKKHFEKSAARNSK